MEKIWFIKRLDIFKNLPENMINDLEDNSFLKEMKKNTVITTPENRDYIYVIKSGKVAIYIENNVKRLITDILKEGEIFGCLTDLEKEYAVALTDVVLCMINKKFFENLITKDLTLNIKIRKYLGLKRYNIELNFSDIIFKSVEERLISILSRLSSKFGVKEKEEDFIKINILLTHQDIADMIGSTRETVSKLINKLKKENLMKTKKKFIYLNQDRFHLE